MPTAGWKNPRWAEITDPIYRQIFESLESWTLNPQVATISTPRSTVTATYNAVTDRVDQPPPVTLFGDQLVEGKIQSSNYVAGSAGWVINSDGNAEFNNVTVRGNIAGGTIDIGGADSTSFHVDAAGNMWTGAAAYADAPFRVAAAGNVEAGGKVAAGHLAGLHRFSATSGVVDIREALHLANIDGTKVARFLVAAAGPTYTEVGYIQVNGAAGGVMRIVAPANLVLDGMSGGSLTVSRGTLNGAIVGHPGAGSIAWIQSGSVGGNTTGNQLAITFPAAFPGTPVVVLSNGSSAFGPADVYSIAAVSASGFTANIAGAAGAFRQVNYIATYAA